MLQFLKVTRQLINPFVPNALFLYPLKTSENRKVFWCFWGVEKGCIGNKWVKISLSSCTDSEALRNASHVRKKSVIKFKLKSCSVPYMKSLCCCFELFDKISNKRKEKVHWYSIVLKKATWISQVWGTAMFYWYLRYVAEILFSQK